MRDTELKLGPDGLALGHHYEGCSLTAYPDPATGGDPWTCGRGCTGTDSEGKPIEPGTAWTAEKADHEYCWRMDTEFGPGVKAAIVAEMTQKQYDALVDLAFNIGMGNFRSSTLVKLFNSGDHAGAAEQFPRWNKGAGRVMKGLQRRRWAERHVFLGGDAADGIRLAEKKYP